MVEGQHRRGVRCLDRDDFGLTVSDVSLLGLGRLGRALGRALLEAGHDITVWNRTSARGSELRAQGARLAGSVHEAVMASPLVIVCLIDHPATFDVLADTQRDALAGRTLVQLSGGRPDEVARLRDWVDDRGGAYLAGVVKAYPTAIGADEAEIQVAGSEPVFDACSSTLSALGRLVYAGPDVVAAAHLYRAQSAFFETVLCSFFETMAYGANAQVPRALLLRLLPETLQLAARALDDAAGNVRREPSGLVLATEAALDTYTSALAAAVRTMRGAGARSALAEQALDYLTEASAAGLGSHEISALLSLLLDERPPTT